MNERVDHDKMLDTMLAELPQAPLPAGFVADVMARVEGEAVGKTAVVIPPFRLQFLDFVLPTFVALFLGAVFVLIGQTDWLTFWFEIGDVAAIANAMRAALPANGGQLGLIITAVVGEIALAAVICLRLWGGSIEQIFG